MKREERQSRWTWTPSFTGTRARRSYHRAIWPEPALEPLGFRVADQSEGYVCLLAFHRGGMAYNVLNMVDPSKRFVCEEDEQERFLAAVRDGLADSEAGHVIADEELGRDLDEAFGALAE